MVNGLSDLLIEDFLRNINIIYFLENYPLTVFRILGKSALIRAKSDRDWIMISSRNEYEFQLLLSNYENKFKNFAFIEDWMIPVIASNKKIEWQLSTTQYFLPSETCIPDKKHITASLNEHDADFIVNNSDYGAYLSVEYVKDRIRRAPSAGIYIDNRLAAWIHTHDDMAIGSLHVIPEYRRQGFGISLTIDLINKIRKLGKIPLVYIEPTNTNSLSLVKKLGFKTHKNINWLALR